MQKDNPVKLARFQWLIERALAGHFDDKQAENFGIHPGGPILPYLCREARRLPPEYGTLPKGISPVLALAVAPSGELCIATVVDDWITVICGETRYWLQKLPTPDHGRGLPKCTSVRILGFSPMQEPITEVAIAHKAKENDLFLFYSKTDNDSPYCRTESLYKGMNQFDSGPFCGATMLDGRLYYARFCLGAKKALVDLYCDGEKFGRQLDDFIVRFCERDGRMLVLTPFGCVRYAESPDETDPKDANVRLMIQIEDGTADFVTAHGEPCLVTKSASGLGCGLRSLRLADSENTPAWQVPIGVNAYRRGFTALGDDRFAYIGTTKRDGFECWVAGGEEQVGFDCVSPLFQLDGGWAYWGALNGHLYLMDIPAKEG